ncbi:hypothetical protein Zmor_009309 [Zophobas morio]|uniref:Uncharacterized protein n=1 Tax=Zophobas morio TaxID=2755281 RepID=A0AA38ILP2_9CUCU|nr:hypothetical protein Zmor_009309 [Zophobas morio]
MDVPTFVDKFHTLQGPTLADKQKTFNSLLTNIPADHDALLSSLTPTTHFETLLKLQLLLRLKRTPDLLQVLKNEHELLPAKLLKNKWFCQQLAATLDDNSAGFVDAVLPHTSYVIRQRIITKLAVYGTKLDTVYEEVRTRYGAHIASPLVVACTPSKIEQVLTSDRVALTPLCQKLLYQKQPQLFTKYAKNVEDSVYHYVARRNLEDFVELNKSGCVGGALGKHLTRRLLTSAKEVVIAQAGNFSCVIHLKTVIKVLTDHELKQFFFNCSPQTIDNHRSYYSHIGFSALTKALGTRYYRLLFDNVATKFHKSLYDFPNLVDNKMLETMDSEERLKWVSIKKKSGTSDDLVPFLTSEDAIGLIKKKINVTSSISTREQLVRDLVKTCQVNGDLNALAEVGEYVCSRHRNDNECVLISFVGSIESLFSLEKLGERHWESINQILKIVKVDWIRGNFDLKYIEFLFREKKLSDEKICDFYRTKKEWYRTEIKELRKVLLLKFIDLVPQFEKENLEYTDLKYLKYILDWNSQADKDNQIRLSDHPRLIQSLQKSMTMAIEVDSYIPELHLLSPILTTLICTKRQSDLRAEAIQNYFTTGFRFFNQNIDMWLLKHQPWVIDNHLDKFLEHLFHGFTPNLSLLNYIKTFTPPSFQRKVVNHALANLAKFENIDVIFHVLVILEPPQAFLEHIAPFYPSGDKVLDETDDDRRQSNVATAIASSFKYATSVQVLPKLIQYCKGDFLRYSLESLYYLFYHSPENQLSSFVNDLSSKAVSVRKHSIFLTCIVGSVADVQKLVTRFIENERNVSVQKHLFTAALKYFIRNPSDEFWQCVKVCMSKLDKNDSESFDLLVNIDRIPHKYQTQHVIFVWDILNKSENSRPRLLSSIPVPVFTELPLDFLLEVITNNFFQTESSCANVIDNFVVTSLTHSIHKNRVLDTVFQLIKKVKITDCSLPEEVANRKKLSSFVDNLVSSVTLSDDYTILPAFSQRWHDLFSVTQAMQEHLRLSFALLYLQGGKDLTQFATAVAEFLDNLVTTYGVVVVDCFASVLKKSLMSFLCCYNESNEALFKFVLYLVGKDNLVFYLLAIKLLPEEPPEEDAAKKLFEEVVRVLRQVPQESIQMLMNVYVMDLVL